MTDQKHTHIIELVQSAPFLYPNEKEFLISHMESISPLERLKIQKDIQAGKKPQALQQLEILQQQFRRKETPQKPDLISKIVQAVVPAKPKKVLSNSILSNTTYLGSNPPQAANLPPTPFQSLDQFTTVNQLSSLNPTHITFELNENGEQKVHQFFDKLDAIIGDIHDIYQKRSLFMNFVQSPLYLAYMDTGLTALRHPEITPPNIILNRLQQIDPKYLNAKQFQVASRVSSHLRMVVGI
jgi:hypothetical protein